MKIVVAAAAPKTRVLLDPGARGRGGGGLLQDLRRSVDDRHASTHQAQHVARLSERVAASHGGAYVRSSTQASKY